MNSSTYVYLDNFRGFSKVTFQLKDVNFFVGENSTGKTSVLALLNIIFSPHFWFSQQFNTSEYDFGGFRDILSASVSKEKEFTVGAYRIQHQKDGKDKCEGFVASFKDHEGLPLCSFLAVIDGINITAIKLAQVDSYYIGKGEIKDHSQLKFPEIFSYVENWKINPSTDFKSIPKQIPQGLGLVPLMQIANALDADKNPSKIEISAFKLPMSLYNMVWLAPIRTRPHRTYDGYGKDFSPEGEHTPFVLRKRLSSKENVESFENALKQFGKASGLFKKVSIHNLGKGAADPFEILVTLASKALRIDSVGYGISQVLPLLVEILVRPKESWFAIQQPEVHLHPKAQAALGDLLYQVANNENKRFLIETHSDFTIDRFRMNFRKFDNAKKESQILFFERYKEGNRVSMIPILPNGEYGDNQPDQFRDFFLKEQMNILGI